MMDREDQRAIDALFDRLAQAARDAPPRDPEAEDYIHRRLERQPGAAYFLAQTVIAQERALANASRRLEEVDRARAPGQRGGPFGGPWGSAGAAQPGHGGGFGRGGGFLAGAAQTALGVAGGVMLGSAMADLFDIGEPEAGGQAFADGQGLADTGEAGFDDGGGLDGGGFLDGGDLGGEW